MGLSAGARLVAHRPSRWGGSIPPAPKRCTISLGGQNGQGVCQRCQDGKKRAGEARGQGVRKQRDRTVEKCAAARPNGQGVHERNQ